MFLIVAVLLSFMALAGDYHWPVYYNWPSYKAPSAIPDVPAEITSAVTEPDREPTETAKTVAPVPIVWIYCSPSYCPPCERAKADARAGLFPFELRQGVPPPGFEIDSYPVFHWNSPTGKGYRWPRPDHPEDANYQDASHLIPIWRLTMQREAGRVE